MQQEIPDHIYKIALTQIPGVGPVLAKNLLSYCGNVAAVFNDKVAHLSKIPGIGPHLAKTIHHYKNFDKAFAEHAFINKNNIQAIFFADDAYPQRLKHCADGPVMLYYKGQANLNQSRMLAIVGTRMATDYGKAQTEKIIETLLPFQPTIVSGLAYGIDVCAHKSALKNNLQTIAVLAHGLDRMYPAVHKSVADKMVHSGGLLTEYGQNTNPDRENFPARNRIVAGLCDAVIVIEAGVGGGALITADLANGYNRDVFAIPGRVDDAASAGCNQLIKSNKANLIESAADIVYLLGWKNEKQKQKTIQRNLFAEISKDEQMLVDLLSQQGAMNIDNLLAQNQLPASKIAALLLNLEFNGIVKSLPGKMFTLI
ncbi:MAG: DNA-protecting protein DprA [Bacteroidia bacterium]|nr:DNA-protecting protein DprA [Bacteroidia bacterium]